MKKILLLDTSIASDNKGDEIIMECVYKELEPILKDAFVRTIPTHVSSFHWYQVWRGLNAVKSYETCDFKFVGGSNILVQNLTTYYPQWNVNIFNYRPFKGCILVGVGAGAKAEKGSDWHTRYVYHHMLNNEYYHSVRDERSKKFMEYLGFKAINTGCVTMWMMTPEFTSQIPYDKSNIVVFTLTAKNITDNRDQFIIDTLLKNYKEVYFWPQGLHDYDYLHKFNNISKINLLQSTKDAYDTFLTNIDTDYVGTRLHGGIYAMRHKRRSIIISIDERARGINESNNLITIDKINIVNLPKMIQSKLKTQVKMNIDNINKWKQQFI